MTHPIGPPLGTDMRSLVGRMLQEKYHLREYLQEGNFGAVYRADHYILGRPVRRVAVKLSKQTGFDLQTARDLFGDIFLLAEAMDELTDFQVLSHLVHVYDAGILPQEQDRLFLVMEYVPGTSLAEQFQSWKQVPANILLKWSLQICQAVAGLHNLVPPIIHRDLKPDNILLGLDQRIRVVDFGLAARMLSSGKTPTTLGVLKYMAPEAMQGELLPASDVYTIGILMYEGLTGVNPFDHLVHPRDLPDSLYRPWRCQQLQKVRPTPPKAMNPSISLEFQEIILRCLSFRPQDRYLHAGHLLEDLEILAGDRQPSPDEAALQEGQRLHRQGDLPGARKAFKRGLAEPRCSDDCRFQLYRSLGDVEIAAGNKADGALYLAKALELSRGRGFLDGPGRLALLDKIVRAYQELGNTFQVERFQSEKNRLLGRQ